MLRTSIVLLLALAACNDGGDSDSSSTDSGAVDSGVTLENDAPTLAAEGESMVRKGDTISFSITLTDEDVDSVTLTATSSDDAVFASADITVEGTGASRTVTATALALGSATLTVEAVDADAASASTTLDVLAVANRTSWTGFTQLPGGSSAALSALQGGPEGQIYTSNYHHEGKFVATVSRWNEDGTIAWTTQLDAPRDAQSGRLKVLPSGDVLFAAQAKFNSNSNYQYAYLGSVKPDGTGPTELQRLDAFDGAGGNHTVPGGLDVASDGGYAVGVWAKAGSDEGCGVTRFTSANAESFRTTLVAGSGQCRQTGVHVSGDKTVAAFSAEIDAQGDTNGGGWDAWLVMLDASGANLWSDHLSGAGDQWMSALDEDADGNIYMCGSSGDVHDDGNTGLGDRDALLRKYDASGTVLWTQRWGTAALDGCYAMDIADDGTIYLAGVENYSSVTTHGTTAVWAFDTDGTQLWSTSMPTQQPATTFPQGIALDGFDLLVGGHTNGSFPGASGSGSREGWITRLDRDGNLQ